ncbi:MAG: DMT family transporter [Candidatus Methanomethyliaceae archaeon]|nr:DMT family transporter [Candidatus Methanomethyliaceae archaeon]
MKAGATAGLLLSTIIWGVSFPVVKAALGEMDPFLFVFLRFGIASLVVLCYSIIFKKDLRKLFRSRILWVLGITNAIGFVMEFYGMTLTTASKASLLVNVNVVFMAIFAAHLLNEKMTARTIAGILLGLIGVALITTEGDISRLSGGSVLGDLIVFLGGIVWAYSNIYNKRAATELGMSPMEVTESMTLISTLGLMPFLSLSTWTFNISPLAISSIIYLAIVCTIFGFYLFYRALRELTVVNTGIILLFEIVVAVVIANIFLGEVIPPIGYAGGILIGAGIILVS